MNSDHPERVCLLFAVRKIVSFLINDGAENGGLMMCKRGENIYKRRDGRYEGRYMIEKKPDGKVRYGYIYSRKYTEVKRLLTEKRNMYLDRSRTDGSHSPCMSCWAKEWQNRARYRNLKPSSRQKYDQMLEKHILPFFGCIAISQIEEKMIQEFTDDLVTGKGLSPSTVNSVIRLFKELLQDAYKAKKIKEIPEICPTVERTPHREGAILSRESEKKLLQYVEKKDLPAIISLYTGLRIGEICALRWKDVDLAHRTISVCGTVQRLASSEGEKKTSLVFGKPKSATSHRIVPLPLFLVEEMRQYKEAFPQNEYIFGRGTRPADPRTVQFRFRQLLRRADISPVNFHALRHTFTTRLLEAGVDVKTISALLGHSSVRTTMDIYAHSEMSTKQSAIDLLAKNIGR